MVHVNSVDLLCLYLFCWVYQSLEPRMWNVNSSTFLRIYVSIGQIDNNNIIY